MGAFLSGGLDSSLVVATVADSVQSPVRTFSIGFEEKKYSELPFASEVARHCGTVHTEEIVTPEAVRDLDDLLSRFSIGQHPKSPSSNPSRGLRFGTDCARTLHPAGGALVARRDP